MKHIRLFLAVAILTVVSACSASGPLGPELDSTGPVYESSSEHQHGSGG